jgi:acyl-CoA reductase-like NAD-dependent aldehyde dehydrogenase
VSIGVCDHFNLVQFHLLNIIDTKYDQLDYAGWCGKLGGESFPADDGSGLIRIVYREAIGVCAAIVAFNGPIGLMAMKAAPCLAAGNSIIIKASEKSPLSSLYLGQLANMAGFPPGVVNFVSGDGETGALLAAHMGIDHISFTGSVEVGKKVAQAAAQSNLKRVSLELGGKSPSIIFADANLDIAIQWCVQGIVGLSGQACFASSRLYVHRDIKEHVIQRMKDAFEAMDGAYGDSHDATTLHPPMVDRKHFNRVFDLIEGGKNEATLVTGGERMFDKVLSVDYFPIETKYILTESLI